MNMIVNNIGQTSATEAISAKIHSAEQLAAENQQAIHAADKQPLAPADKAAQSQGPKAGSAADKKNISKNEIESVIKDIQSQLDFMNTKIAFKVDAKYGEPVVQVIRKNNGEVLWQFPPEQLLKIRAAFRDIAKGIFLNEKI
ncbi:MAG: flagellar protein FlaG [Dissulfurimicrobium sp.]|uniref:flagellar protein FlaG n=1 Tax=Dissulfurimicrobium sp. TaxID=2022436 RepID=UPI004049CE8A